MLCLTFASLRRNAEHLVAQFYVFDSIEYIIQSQIHFI